MLGCRFNKGFSKYVALLAIFGVLAMACPLTALAGGTVVSIPDASRLVGNGLPVHNLDTGEDFATFQAAIDAANTTDGHTITVDSGNYTKNVAVYKQPRYRVVARITPADAIG